MDNNSNSTVDSGEKSGDIAWMLMSSSLVFIMIPGVGFFYSGLANSKSALSLLILSLWSFAIVFIQWFFIGYSLTFSKTSSNPFIGDFNHLFLWGLLNSSNTDIHIPEILFCLYQGLFACITPILILGAGSERNRFLPTILFIFIWTCIVYDPIAFWTWNENGWSFKLGSLDFAGGSPIHIASGSSALAMAYVIGKRPFYKAETKPHNMTKVFLGTVLLWFGWFGFNGGSALASNSRAIMAIIVTNLAASVGAISWVILDYIYRGKHYSPVGFCCGAIAGLVAITPGSGFVSPSSSLVFGLVGSICCNFAMDLKHLLHYDDALDVFAVHGIGGMIGNILTGIFAQNSIASLDSSQIKGGWLDGNWLQVPIQLADSAAVFAWSFTLTLLILSLLNLIPGLKLRVNCEDEDRGLDRSQFDCSAYEFIDENFTFERQIQNARKALVSPTANPNNNKIFGIDNYSFERNQRYPYPLYTSSGF